MSCYHIFIENNVVKKFSGNKASQANFESFSKDAVKATQENSNSQIFTFKNDSLVKTGFLEHLNGSLLWDDLCRRFAETFLSEQIVSQNKISKMKKKITPGSLLVIHYQDNNTNDVLILIKIEQEEVANAASFERIFAILLEKQALNTAFAIFEKSKETSLLISRTNAFWVQFLGVTPLRENRVNTFNVFKSIDAALKTTRRRGFKSDYLSLRNHFITYLRNNDGMSIAYNDLVTTVFDAHKSIDQKFDSVEFAKKIRKIPSVRKGDKAFDLQFEVDMVDVKAKLVNTKIELTDKIELNLKDGVENLEQIIHPYDEGGVKGIIICSEEGYKYFSDKGK